MKGKELLFVTYHDEKSDEGLSYAIELAKTMNDRVGILLLYKRKVLEKFEDMMTAVTFAESNEHKTARELISEDLKEKNEDLNKKLALMEEKCRNAGVPVEVSTAAMDAVSAIKNILRENPRIDLVLLSPSITNDGHVTAKTLNKLVKTASRPIVTMAKQAQSA
jgi:DNA gyrase/topoisomerase IV subunit A